MKYILLILLSSCAPTMEEAFKLAKDNPDNEVVITIKSPEHVAGEYLLRVKK